MQFKNSVVLDRFECELKCGCSLGFELNVKRGIEMLNKNVDVHFVLLVFDEMLLWLIFFSCWLF